MYLFIFLKITYFHLSRHYLTNQRRLVFLQQFYLLFVFLNKGIQPVALLFYI